MYQKKIPLPGSRTSGTNTRRASLAINRVKIIFTSCFFFGNTKTHLHRPCAWVASEVPPRLRTAARPAHYQTHATVGVLYRLLYRLGYCIGYCIGYCVSCCIGYRIWHCIGYCVWHLLYRLVQIERQKMCPREFLTPFFRVRPRNFAHIFWKAVSKTRRGGVFNLGFRCRDIRVLTPPRVKYSSRDPE